VRIATRALPDRVGERERAGRRQRIRSDDDVPTFAKRGLGAERAHLEPGELRRPDSMIANDELELERARVGVESRQHVGGARREPKEEDPPRAEGDETVQMLEVDDAGAVLGRIDGEIHRADLRPEASSAQRFAVHRRLTEPASVVILAPRPIPEGARGGDP
jgi:hypothetical protein